LEKQRSQSGQLNRPNFGGASDCVANQAHKELDKRGGSMLVLKYRLNVSALNFEMLMYGVTRW